LNIYTTQQEKEKWKESPVDGNVISRTSESQKKCGTPNFRVRKTRIEEEE
jgi:hypothetical protein